MSKELCYEAVMTDPETIYVNGQALSVIEVPFQPLIEPWNEYSLTGGGKVRLRTTVTRVMQVVDSIGVPLFNPDGTPSLIVSHKSEIFTLR